MKKCDDKGHVWSTVEGRFGSLPIMTDDGEDFLPPVIITIKRCGRCGAIKDAKAWVDEWEG